MNFINAIAIIVAAIIGAIATILTIKNRRFKHSQLPKPKKNEKVYKIEGNNEDGSKYSGLAYLSSKKDKIRIRYFIGNELWAGEGPKENNTIHIFGKKGDFVATYKKMNDGSFYGDWGHGGKESLIPLF